MMDKAAANFFLLDLFQTYNEGNLPKKPEKLDTWMNSRRKKNSISVVEAILAAWPALAGKHVQARSYLLQAWSNMGYVEFGAQLKWNVAICLSEVANKSTDITSIEQIAERKQHFDTGNKAAVRDSGPLANSASAVTKSGNLGWLDAEARAWSEHVLKSIRNQRQGTPWYVSDLQGQSVQKFKNGKRPPGVPASVSVDEYVASVLSKLCSDPRLAYGIDSSQRAHFWCSDPQHGPTAPAASKGVAAGAAAKPGASTSATIPARPPLQQPTPLHQPQAPGATPPPHIDPSPSAAGRPLPISCV